MYYVLLLYIPFKQKQALSYHCFSYKKADPWVLFHHHVYSIWISELDLNQAVNITWNSKPNKTWWRYMYLPFGWGELVAAALRVMKMKWNCVCVWGGGKHHFLPAHQHRSESSLSELLLDIERKAFIKSSDVYTGCIWANHFVFLPRRVGVQIKWWKRTMWVTLSMT